MKPYKYIFIALAVVSFFGILAGATHHIATLVICLVMAYQSHEQEKQDLKDRHKNYKLKPQSNDKDQETK